MLTNDTGVYQPPGVVLPPSPPALFVPPTVGESYVDPVFGETIRRLSDAKARGVAWIATEYPTVCPYNCDASRLLLLHVDHFGLYDWTGFVRDLPIGASDEPRWSRHDTQLLYYHNGNQLLSMNVQSGKVETVHTFTEYQEITGKGESDISADGDHLVLCGDDREVFIYTLKSDTKGPVLDISEHPVDSLYLTPSNEILISWS